jgi:putative ABC transport system substrate-binding protein
MIGSLSGSPGTTAFGKVCASLSISRGRNIIIEWRGEEGNRDRQRAFAAELVHLKVDVIVAVGGGDIRAAKEATTTIPIVSIEAGGPVANGFVASLA